jgi:hypothetical protein
MAGSMLAAPGFTASQVGQGGPKVVLRGIGFRMSTCDPN